MFTLPGVVVGEVTGMGPDATGGDVIGTVGGTAEAIEVAGDTARW